MLVPGAQPPKSCPAPKFLIGSIVISLSRCCLPNDEGPGPRNIFFLEPPLHHSYHWQFQRRWGLHYTPRWCYCSPHRWDWKILLTAWSSNHWYQGRLCGLSRCMSVVGARQTNMSAHRPPWTKIRRQMEWLSRYLDSLQYRPTSFQFNNQLIKISAKQQATLSQRWPRDAPNIWVPWKL